MLGNRTFGRALREFMSRWHGKHPIPWDFFYTFNNVTGKKLNWFWNSWYFSNNYIDLSVGVKTTPAGSSRRVTNIGLMPASFDLLVKYSDGTQDSVHWTFAVREKTPAAVTIALRHPPGGCSRCHKPAERPVNGLELEVPGPHRGDARRQRRIKRDLGRDGEWRSLAHLNLIADAARTGARA